MCVIEKMKKIVSLLLAMVLLLQYIPAPAFAEETPETGLCAHHAVHENCGYVAAIAGVDCNHEHDDSCFTTKCAHVHGDCGYVAAVEGEEPKEEIPCGHNCAGEEACNEKVLNCAHVHSESCGYAAAVEGKACEFVCEACAAEEAAVAAVAEVKALIDALPEVEKVQEMALEEKKAAYDQTQAAYDAYGKLTEEQKALLPDSEEVFKPLFDYFNTLIDADGEIGSGTPDGTPPVLKGVTLSRYTTTPNSTIEVTVDASDDVSGLDHARVNFHCEETGKDLDCYAYASYHNSETGQTEVYADGLLHGTLKIDQYVETGTFCIDSVSIWDIAENYINYNSYTSNVNHQLPTGIRALTLKIFNTTPDVTTSVAKPEFVETVENAANDAYIAADYSGNATLSEELFDAIAGTDKTIDLISEGITWRFEGSEITNTTKPIDLSVQITKAEENTSADGEAIQDKLNGTTGVVMKFAENGTLPGKATIQVKVDYAMREYLGSDKGLCVYYYNNQTGELEVVARNLTVINDTYVEFEITHCSYYVLTTPVADAEEILKGSCGANLTWTLSKKAGVLTISGTGPMTDYSWNNLPGWREDYKVMQTVTSVVVEKGVTTIGSYAFWDLDNAATIVLPEGLTKICDGAFGGCDALKELIIPDSVVEIGKEAICYMPLLKSLHIPEKVGKLDEWNFFSCPALANISVDANNLSYTSVDGVLYDKYVKRFIYCPEGYKEKLTIPSTVVSIDCSRLNSCVFLKEIEVDAANTAFSSVNGILYDQNVTTLIYCPQSYEGTLHIPATVADIASGACYAPGLKAISVDAQNTVYSAHGGVLYNKNGTELIFCPRGFVGELNIPEDVTTIVEYAVLDCNGISTITFPKTISKLEPWSVAQCSKLKRIIFSGTAPVFEAYSLGNLTASAYYPAEDSSWTADLMQGYGGNITWIPHNSGGVCGDDLSWTYEISTGTLTITGSGDIYNYSLEGSPWNNYYIEEVIFSGNIARIGNYAFSGCEGLTHITIPDTVISMGTAFYHCPDLVWIDIPSSVVTIHRIPTDSCNRLEGIWVASDNPAYCSDSDGVLYNKDQSILIQAPVATTKSYIIPDTVSQIGAWAFSGCYNLTSIKLPDYLTEISQGAFSGCTGLRSIVIPETLITLGNKAFGSCRLKEVVFAGKAPTMASDCFNDAIATAYYHADLPSWTTDMVQNYGGEITWEAMETSGSYGDTFSWTFDEGTGTLTISGEGILYAGSNYAVSWYRYRNQIKNVVIEDGVTILGEDMFTSSPNVSQVTLPGTVTAISYDAFSNCTTLKQVAVPESVESIHERAFSNCTDLETITIPDSVHTIKESAFSNCTSLTEVTIPSSVTEIAYATFAGCSSLTEISIPSSVTSITYNAFENCSGLQEVTISGTVTNIMEEAFAGCTNLTTVTLSTNPANIAESAFDNCGKLKTIVLSEDVKNMGAQSLAAFPNVTTIRFTGDVPNFDPNSFQGVTADAYYPADNATWTGEVRQNYGGNITWIAVGNGNSGSGSGSTPTTPPSSGNSGGSTGGGTSSGTTGGSTNTTTGTTIGNTTGNTTGNTGTVTPTVTVPSSDVVVIEKSEIDQAIQSANSANSTVVEISVENRNGESVSLPVESLEKVADAGSILDVVTTDVTISLDSTALNAIVQQSGGKEILLQYQEIKEAKLNSNQKNAIKDQLSSQKGQKHVLTFTVELIAGDTTIHDFAGGTATIKIPFELPEGTKAENYAVFYLNANGEIERYETTYDGEFLIVELRHFSEYAVVYEPDDKETEVVEVIDEVTEAEISQVSEMPETQTTSGLPIAFWIVLLVVALIGTIILLFILRKQF